MPKVPTYDNFQVSTGGASGARFDAPVVQNAAPQQMQQLGQAAQGAGNMAGRIATDMQQQANQVQLSTAQNAAMRKQIELTFDPERGFRSLKGESAMNRPDGKALPDEYGEKFQLALSEISAGLGNDAQKRIFAMQSADMVSSFRGDAEGYMLSEYRSHALSTQEGTLLIGADTAKLNWDKPDKIGLALDSVKAAIVETGRINGEAASATMAKMKEATSAVHEGVIDAALKNGNPTYAEQYLGIVRGQMTSAGILKTTGLVNHGVDGRRSMDAVKAASGELASQIQPTDMDRLKNVRDMLESGGKDYRPDGSPVTSPKGAMYKNQVMPATAKDPGYGIAPAKDNSPQEYNRVGDELLDKLVQKYGDPALALAAYNAGAGTLDAAIKKARTSVASNKNDPTVPVRTWLDFMPSETRSYVRNGMAKLDNGGGAPQFPTEIQFVQSALNKLGDNPRMEQVKLTQAQAMAQYAMLDKSRKEQGYQAVAQAQQALIQNGGSFADLAPQVKANAARYAPDKYASLQDFAQKLAKGEDSTSPRLYDRLTNNPAELAGLSDNAFFALHSELNDADFKHFSNERAKLQGKGGGGSAGELNSTAIKQSLNERLQVLKINPAPKDDGGKDAARVGGIRRFVDQYFYAAQREAGKKFNEVEVNQHLDALFAKNATFRSMWGDSSGAMLTLQAGDIGGDVRDRIKASYKKQGIDNPTDAQIMQIYWISQTARK